MEKVNAKEKSLKQARPNKKQSITVVYISNPIKVEASPANFRAVVQELTGQESDVTYMFDTPSTSGNVESPCNNVAGGASVDLTVANIVTTVDFPFDMFEDAFTSQILEDFLRISQSDNPDTSSFLRRRHPRISALNRLMEFCSALRTSSAMYPHFSIYQPVPRNSCPVNYLALST